MKPFPTLKARRDFKKVSQKGQKWVTASFILQGLKRKNDEALSLEKNLTVRVGYTVSKKVGKAVLRNKVKRRLREAVKIAFKESKESGCDYVIIARRGCDQTCFREIVKELTWALKHLHRLLA